MPQKRHILSFRAECEVDVNRFCLQARLHGPIALTVRRQQLLFEDGRSSGEVAVEIESSEDLEYMRDVIRDVPDGHVMLQTLRPIPLADNELRRDYNLF